MSNIDMNGHNTYVYIYIYDYICIHTCIYVCMYIYIYGWITTTWGGAVPLICVVKQPQFVGRISTASPEYSFDVPFKRLDRS